MSRMPRWLQGVMMEDQFKVFLAVLCALSGVPLLAGKYPAPTSLEASLPHLLIRLWGATLAFGGGLVIAGILIRHAKERRWFLEGLMIESAGLLPLGAAALVLAITAVFAVGVGATFGASIYVMFAAACCARTWAIRRIVKQLRQAIDREHSIEHD